MSQRALEFVELWASENVHAEGDQPEGDNTLGKKLAARCFEAAIAEGIPASEINDAIDDLPAFMGGQIEEANDREADRSDAKDE